MKMLLIPALLLPLAYAIVHPQPLLPNGWATSPLLSLTTEAPARFSLAVRQPGIAKIKAIALDVSDPKSSRYGEYLTTPEINTITAPAADDMARVTSWLSEANVPFRVENSFVHVETSLSSAERLLSTSFLKYSNSKTKQSVVRAGEYTLPASVNDVVDAVFGLHGLPLPPRTAYPMPDEPASVTPAVIAKTYSISGVSPRGSADNKQAVAEFQGQYVKDADLVKFFKKFMPTAKPGDDKVSRVVGSKDEQEGGIEASLDIQYIMGVAPHIQSELWLFEKQDFCADLVNYTTTMLNSEGVPAVHSISYGWQGNLTQVQCSPTMVTVIDNNFAKLAAKGVTIIFASGDSGSGYTPPEVHCMGKEANMTNHTMHVGTVEMSLPVDEYSECCEQAEGDAWTYVPPGKSPWPTCSAGGYGEQGKVYTGEQIYALRNTIEQCCSQAQENQGYFSYIPGKYPSPGYCSVFYTINGTTDHPGAYYGKPQRPIEGVCTIFSSTTGSTPQENALSGAPASALPVMWPSWPASSPWVTSVGATRFVGQKVGNEEMATDQFGSGGGFSTMFPQPDWQKVAVQHYVNNPPNDPHYPPKGSFPPNGRATPDVSGLGEGYQVYTNGELQPVGGTSASSPMFAGIVALLNEARIQKGGKPLGFLNPFLYQHADAFTDITTGTNAIGRGDGPIKYGFNCTKGWDPATGLGTPIFSKLLAASLNVSHV